MMRKPWWKEAVVYQIYVKSFFDSNGDGIGDLAGVTEKLQYLSQLGVDAVWLCPFFESPMKDNGYDISDYYKIAPEFGSMSDMRELLESAEAIGIKIVIDMVLNHTSNEHAWFKNALENPKSEYRDYYVFKEGGKLPSNARSLFGGSAWEETADGSFYLHTFDVSQPDLNWENNRMRNDIYDMMNFWIDMGVDGFRMDAITFIKKNPAYPSLPSDDQDDMVEISRTALNQPGIQDFLREMKDKTYKTQDFLTVAEAPGVPYEELGEYVGEGGPFSMLFDFSYTDIDITPGEPWYKTNDWTVSELKTKMFHSLLETQKIGWGALYLENHDQPRSINKYFEDGTMDMSKHYYMSSALAVLYMLQRGTPYIYQGQELGMVNRRCKSIDEYDDVSTIDQYKRAVANGLGEEKAMHVCYRRSRDNARTPMQWNSTFAAGFSTVEPWLPVNENYMTINAETQIADDDSVFNFYRRLIRMRKSEKFKNALIDGKVAQIMINHEALIGYERIGENMTISVAVNMTNAEHKVALDVNECLISNYGNIDRQTDNVVNVRPYEAFAWI